MSINQEEGLRMKKQVFFCLLAPILFLFFASVSVSAQSMENLMTVQVPFDFQVGEKTLPAGRYVIKRDPQMPKLLLIQCPEKKILVATYTMTLSLPKEPARASLSFKEYQGKHFLAEVKLLGRGDGYVLARSKTEQKLAQSTKVNNIYATPNGASRND